MRTGQFTLITQNMFRHAPPAQHLAFPAHGCLNEIGTFIVQASKLYILDHFDVSYSQKNIHLTRLDAMPSKGLQLSRLYEQRRIVDPQKIPSVRHELSATASMMFCRLM